MAKAERQQPRWAPGWPRNTYHLVIPPRSGSAMRSRCNLRLDVTEEQLVEEPPADAHTCRSCNEDPPQGLGA